VPGAAQALAFGELALGGLFLTSAITGESMGELFTQGLTPAGQAKLHAKRSSAERTPGAENPSAETPVAGGSLPSQSVAPGNSTGTGAQTAPSPAKVNVGASVFAEWESKLSKSLKRSLTTKEKQALAVAVEKKYHVTVPKI
jgi:hypothetical protein